MIAPDYSLPVPIKPVIEEMKRRSQCAPNCTQRQGYFMDTEAFYKAGCDNCDTHYIYAKDIERSQQRLI